ncbi:phage tail tape measure protein [uncultured Bacteroides sp.]|uniref:phage tail tape measure protein n=1 Tax=uncultured Bacteroides sp. TaxID=162156 RepID=UPI0025925400|nr:phage tail tape measure protein [uncultured Bacteroides sp.]
MSNIYTRLLLNTDKFDKGLFQAQQNLKSFSAQSKSTFAGIAKIGGYAAAFAGISTSIHAAVTANMEFEKSLSSLRSLTGVSAQELNYFRAEAVKMAMDSTQSAVAMVDAYKLIGSQMPELLKNKEALSATARAAVTLAEAAEIDVPTAAKALTGSLNQMGASSARASEYINILAAASQQGSADIPYLNRAIENAGGTASAVGVKFNELVAAIEAIAPRITDAGSAGTNLRNIFLTLEASADNNLKPSVVGLSTAIDNLSKKNLNATELTKMFGKESVTAAIALLQEKDAFDQLRVGIEGTNTAYEQAEINTDNLAGAMTRLQNAWTATINKMAASNGIIAGLVNGLTDLLNQIDRAGQTLEEKVGNDFGRTKNIDIQESNKRIQASVGSGMTMEQALDNEVMNAGIMYDQAGYLVFRQKEMEKKYQEYLAAKRTNINDVAEEELDAYKTAKNLYEISLRENLARQAIYDNVASIRKELAAAAKEEKKLEQAAKDKAAKEEAERLAKEKAGAPEGSIAEIDKQLRELQQNLITATTTQARVAVQETINELQAKKIRLQAEVETTIFQKGKTAPGFVESTTPDLSSMAGGVEMGKFEMPSIQKNIDEADDYAASIADVASAFGMLTGAAQDDQAAMAQWALQSIANIANVISQTMGLAMARGAASAASAPWPANIGAIASVMATLISTFASFPKFADGGIVGGSSYFGDKLLARVNSGELILNQKQQESLYHMTEDDRGGGVTIGFDRVRGSDIYLALKNYMKDTGKKL